MLDSPGLLLVHHKRKNGGKGVRGEDWIQWLKWAYTPLNSHRLVGDSRLKQKQNNQGYLGNTSLEIPSVLEKVWSTLKTDVASRIAFQTVPPCGHSLPNLLPMLSPIWETWHSLQPRLLSSDFPILSNMTRTLNCGAVSLWENSLMVWPSSTLPDTWATAEAAEEKKYPRIRVHSTPFCASESDESQKQ